MANLRVDKITSTETFETTGSVQFDGSGDYLSHAVSSDFQFGSGDFTIECWIYKEATQNDDILGVYNTSSNRRTFLLHTPSEGTIVFLLSPTGSGGTTFTTDENIIEPSTWYHIAVVRNGNDVKIFKNGSLVKSGSYTGSVYTNNDDEFRIGSTHYSAANSREFDGHISNVRIVKGVALYTSNFKPPMRELEVVPGTVLLACQSKTDASLEKTGKTITVTGNAVASELTPGILTPVVKSGGGSAITGSVEFDGTGDYLTIPNTEDLRLADSDFTIEFWATISKVDSTYSPFALFENSSALRSYQLEVRSNGAVRFEWWYNGSSANDITTGTGAVIVNEWYHYAVSRNGATLKLFINGIEVGSSDVGTNSFFNNTVTPFIIGGMFQSGVQQQKWQGNISNFRINKGTALYTDDFIPPTRELKRVPGTVLLCCQDPNNPLTEATGKTITGYGDLQRADGVELIANGHFSSNTDNWTAVGNASLSTSSGQIVLTGDGSTGGGGAAQGFATIVGKKYVLKYEAFSGTISAGQIRIGTSANSFSITFDNSVNASAHDDITFVATSTTTYVTLGLNAGVATSGTFKYDNVSVTLVDGSNKGSNFTPQVGDDRQVTFEGVTKIDTENYFYFPTGNTESRNKGAGTRGISFAGSDASNKINTISHINISTTGNAKDFGDLLDKLNQNAAVSSSTRGISGGGVGTSPTANEIDTLNYITIASAGDALDFGDLTLARRLLVGCSSQTRGIFAGGYDSPNKYNTMDYITIASTGDALDFGDMVADGQTPSGRYSPAGYASPTRGVWHGGYGYPAYRNIIDYATIASKGNTKDFGDSSISNYYMGGCSNSIRGISAGAYNPSPAHLNLIEYTTIATTGNAKDFGDLVQKAASTGACASQIRGVFLGGIVGGSKNNSISYVTIMTMGNALDFGDLTTVTGFNAGCSNGHGGLG